jgi:hypothetical protein
MNVKSIVWIGTTLFAMRNAYHLSERAMARELKLTRRDYRFYEDSKRPIPDELKPRLEKMYKKYGAILAEFKPSMLQSIRYNGKIKSVDLAKFFRTSVTRMCLIKIGKFDPDIYFKMKAIKEYNKTKHLELISVNDVVMGMGGVRSCARKIKMSASAVSRWLSTTHTARKPRFNPVRL